MRFPIIKVRDNDTGHEHIIGTDSHDSLIIDGGKITYYNLQCGEGSEFGTYSFLGIEDEFLPRVEFVTFEELQNIYNKQKKINKLNDTLRQEIIDRVLSRRESD